MSEDEQMAVIAVVLNRCSEEWALYTHTPTTLRDMIVLNNMSAKNRKTPSNGTGDRELDAFNAWARDE